MARRKVTPRSPRTWLKRVGIGLLVGLGAFILLSAVLMWSFWARHHNEPEVIGVSFSQVQAERFGSDWHANYIALLDDLHARHLRIATYWDRLEPQPGTYDFSEFDWMVTEAQKRGAKLTLVVGQKTLRYPECYYPAWLDRTNSVLTGDQATHMVTKVVQHFKDSSAIEGWQVENEFLLRSFGECPAKNLTRSQLKREVAAVHAIDSSRPILLTQSDQFGFPFFGPFEDMFGFSMYRWSYREDYGYFRYPQPGAYNWLKAAWIETLTGQKVYIHELQAEAWGPKGNEEISLSEQAKSMSPAQFRDIVRYARDTKIRRFDLWGSEWWYWLKVTKNQPAMWDEVKKLLNP